VEGGPVNAIRIRKKLESDTLHLPELHPFLGQTVEIIVLEDDATLAIRPGTGDWDAAARAVQNLAGYDFDAWREQRGFDQPYASDSLP
jgi:hypothetical protein